MRLAGYLWGFRKPDFADKSFEKFREFYPNGKLFCRVDYHGKLDEYRDMCKKYDAKFSVNPFQVGYCGTMEASGHIMEQKGWPQKNWLDGLYNACLEASIEHDYMIILEEDVFILKELTEPDSSIAIIPQSNGIPSDLLQYIKDRRGNVDVPGYGAGGGTIINIRDFIDAWRRCSPSLQFDYERLFNISHLMGWQDFILQFVMMLDNKSVKINPQLKEVWNTPNWKDYEIVNYLKDWDEVKKL
jgi:hypothetical protein